jgi:hypothetical protein
VGNPYRRTAEICRLRLTFGGAERQTKKIKEDAEFRGFFDLSSSGFGAARAHDGSPFFARRRKWRP